MLVDYPRTSGSRRSYVVMGKEELYTLALKKLTSEKLYLNPFLTMEIMADEMNVHRNALSAAINQYAGLGFSAWVASYRIAEVEQLSALPENRFCTIENLAQKAGFTNRKSFNRMYKAIRKAKPSETLPGRKRRKS